MSFASALAKVKEENGLSISEISRRTGVDRKLVKGYLDGATPIPANRRRMADGLLASELESAGFLTLECEECGSTFSADPHDKRRKFCKRTCNTRSQTRKHQGYVRRYELGRAKHELALHRKAVAKFCQWCVGSDKTCPDPTGCPLAGISPYNYDRKEPNAK